MRTTVLAVILATMACGPEAADFDERTVDHAKHGQTSQNVLPVSCATGCYGAQHECVTAAQDTPSLDLVGECVLICGPYTASACYAAGGWCPYLADGSQVCAVYP